MAVLQVVNMELQAGHDTAALRALLRLRVEILGNMLDRVSFDEDSLAPASQAMKEVALAVYSHAAPVHKAIKRMFEEWDAMTAPASDKPQ